MTVSTRLLRRLCGAFALCSSAVLAQTTSTITIDVCRGKAEVTEQRQQGTDLQLDVAVTVADCDGVCIGSLEYGLLLVAEDGRESKVQLTENWTWRDVRDTFTLTVRPAIAPGMTLREVTSMQIGRCSCSYGQITVPL